MPTGRVADDDILTSALVAGRKTVPASYVVYKDGATYYAESLTGGSDFSGTDAATVINNAMATGGEVIFKKATYSFTATDQLNLVSNLSLTFEKGALFSVPSQNAVGNAGLFKGVLLNNIAIDGLELDGQVGTSVSGVELFTGIKLEGCTNVQIKNSRFLRLSGTFMDFRNSGATRGSNLIFDNNIGEGSLVSGGIITVDQCDNVLITNNIASLRDSGPLIVRSKKVGIVNNYFECEGVNIDIIIQVVTDIIEDISISGNILQMFAAGQGNIAIHDTGTPATSGVFRRISVLGNTIFSGGATRSLGGIIMTLSKQINGLKVQNNLIMGPVQGIAFTLQADQAGIDVSNNTVIHVLSPTQGFGIRSDVSGAAFDIKDSNFSENYFNDIAPVGSVGIQGRFQRCLFRGNILSEETLETASATYVAFVLTNLPNNIIESNQLRTTTIFGGAGIPTNTIVRNNPGFNPQGWATASPSVPATGVDETNTKGYPVLVYITGLGTGITAVGITDNAATLQSFTRTGEVGDFYRLEPGDKIRLTYTGSPTWKWYGL